MQKIIGCAANFSEGRRQALIDSIVRAIADTAGASLLGVDSDVEHNRTVATFAGAPEAIAQAAFAAISTASALIDLNQHRGQHPRIGAADVIPFTPLRNATMAECVALARSLGARVGAELRLPVFLYAEAALKSSSRELSAIRRGGYERLRQRISAGQSPQPDFGPRTLGSAGGCVIGARDILIAFNVYLTTADAAIARSIARGIRESSGGMPHVKALGLFVKGSAQVSMNLTDYRLTSMADALERIRAEAASRGATIHRSEIIGLIPRAALADASPEDLQLLNFTPERILESRLDALE